MMTSRAAGSEGLRVMHIHAAKACTPDELERGTSRLSGSAFCSRKSHLRIQAFKFAPTSAG